MAKIEVNHSGEDNVIGLKVISAPSFLKGTGGSFSGGLEGVRAASTSGTGLIGISTSGGDGIQGIAYAGRGDE